MTEYTPQQQAEIMANARKIHKSAKSVTNVKLAEQMGLAKGRENLERLCLDLGLYPWGEHTELKVMLEHINK